MAWFNLRYRVIPYKTIEGIKVPVYLKYGYSVLRFIDNGAYERSEISIIKNTLNKEDKVLELGTGLGFVSAYCAKHIGSKNVSTYEANISLRPTIQKLYKKNGVNPGSTFALLGSTNGMKTFYKDSNSLLASSSIVSSNKNHVLLQTEEQNLNEVIARLQPTYFIMDIEGGEYPVFKIIDFQTITKIQFELHPSVLGKDEIDFIFKKLKDEGFARDSSFNYPDNYFFERQKS